MPIVTWYVDLADRAHRDAADAVRSRLDGAGWRDGGDAGAGAGGDVAVVLADRPLPEDLVARLRGGGTVVVLAGPTLERADPDGGWAELAGVWPGPPTPRHDVRVRPGTHSPLARITDHAHGGGAHLGDHVHADDRVLTVDKVADDVEVLLEANVGLDRHPLATFRPSTGVLGWTLGGHAGALGGRAHDRLFLHCLRHACGLGSPRPAGIGLLGYGAIGPEHSRAATAVDGLELVAVCDRSPERLAAATGHAPGVRTFTDADDLLTDPRVDAVVVSTPPDTHAAWALRALEAGKHVVVEKPFAVTTADADAVLAAAAERGLLAVVYQNRRYDVDHLAIARLLHSGELGEVFHVEAFVGGHGHPCNLWHSDAAVSGGAVYDWGAHVLDQVLDLLPGQVEWVSAVGRKLLWHDVTNADHTRLTVGLAGAEAHFVHSDVAAALKPRWYVLGTRGAVVGHWRTERVLSRSDIGTLVEDRLAPADSPPLLDLHAADGSVTRLATPPAPPHAFHLELADRLLLGLPMSVTGQQARRVLGVLEAAAVSAAEGGRPVPPR